MKYSGTFIFKAPISMVQEAREKRFENPDQFPELKKHEEIERSEEGDVLKTKRKIELASSVPPALKSVISPDMLKCVDASVYNNKTGEHTWVITPVFKADVFTCKGYSKYTEIKDKDGDVATRRELDLVVTVKVPIIGKAIEQFILDAYKKNLDRDNATIEKMIKIMKSK